MAQTPIGAFTAAKIHAEGTYFEPCKLRTHSAGCPKPLTPHHCVPDHCWKANGQDKSRITITGATRGTMGFGSGLCICVDGAGKKSDSSAGRKYRELTAKYDERLRELGSGGRQGHDSKALASLFRRDAKGFTGGTTNTPANMGQHGKIHHIFDAAENNAAGQNRAGGLGDNVATLEQLENLAAETISEVTGCDEKSLKKQLRTYHKGRGISGKTLLRANASGHGSAQPAGHLTLGSPIP